MTHPGEYSPEHDFARRDKYLPDPTLNRYASITTYRFIRNCIMWLRFSTQKYRVFKLKSELYDLTIIY